MKRLFVMTVLSLAWAGAIVSPLARADNENRETIITFSGPVEIPQTHSTGSSVLPAGTYVFKILDSQSDHHIVQVFSKNSRTIYATILAIPNFRLKATSKTVITFSERPSGQPEAIRAWFYPGANWGEEFVYPKARALELAKTEHVPVLFTPPELPVIEQLKRAPVMTIQPTGEELRVKPVSLPLSTRAETPPLMLAALPVFGTAALLGLAGVIGLTIIRRRLISMENRITWAQYCRRFF